MVDYKNYNNKNHTYLEKKKNLKIFFFDKEFEFWRINTKFNIK